MVEILFIILFSTVCVGSLRNTSSNTFFNFLLMFVVVVDVCLLVLILVFFCMVCVFVYVMSIGVYFVVSLVFFTFNFFNVVTSTSVSGFVGFVFLFKFCSVFCNFFDSVIVFVIIFFKFSVLCFGFMMFDF